MTIMNVHYVGQLRTKAMHEQSGNSLITDAPLDNQGKGEAFSPTDLLCTSLASCKLTIMGIKARSLGFDLDGVEVKVEKIMQTAPRRVAEIILSFNWNGLDQRVSAENMESLKRAALACPVALSLAPEVKRTLNW